MSLLVSRVSCLNPRAENFPARQKYEKFCLLGKKKSEWLHYFGPESENCRLCLIITVHVQER